MKWLNAIMFGHMNL